MVQLQWLRRIGLVMSIIVAAACSNGRGSVDEGGQPQTQPGTFTVGGAVSGLAGAGLVLQLNGGNDLPVNGDGTFAFPSQLSNSASYSVTVRTQPANPPQTCAVSNGSGQISGANVTNVAVVCTTGNTAFPVGGTVTGLLGSGLVLRNNGGDDLPIAMDGEFAFNTPVASGASYDVSVAMEPTNPSQVCSLQNQEGVVAEEPITNISVVCSTSAFTVGGSVTGLAGAGLTLSLNAETIQIAENGQFTFPTPIASTAPYAVTVASQPVGQNCTVADGSGVIDGRNITSVRVTCASNAYTVGGTVTGLASGARVTITLQTSAGASEYVARTNGPYAFAAHVVNGGSYAVRIDADDQPRNPSQRCEVSNPTGIINAANVSNVNVTCVTNSFRVGGAVQGYTGSGLVLTLNGAETLPVASNGSFTFTTPIASGASYEVAVASQPTGPAQTCTVERASGRVGAGDVTNVQVTCATNTYAVRGVVNGLLGRGLVLQNNGDAPIEIQSDGGFEFLSVASGSSYDVTVRTQPAEPTQSCTVQNGAGVVVDRDIANVIVTCTTSSFVVSGVIEGLNGASIVLRNNGEQLSLTTDGAFSFPTPVLSGTAYTVDIVAQPADPPRFCTVENAIGVIGAENVTNVRVTCETLTVGGSVLGLVLNGLQLQLNGAEAISVAPALLASFEFATPLPSGAAYTVTILAQPLPQTCSISNGSGFVGSLDVTSVSVNCL